MKLLNKKEKTENVFLFLLHERKHLVVKKEYQRKIKLFFHLENHACCKNNKGDSHELPLKNNISSQLQGVETAVNSAPKGTVNSPLIVIELLALNVLLSPELKEIVPEPFPKVISDFTPQV